MKVIQQRNTRVLTREGHTATEHQGTSEGHTATELTREGHTATEQQGTNT